MSKNTTKRSLLASVFALVLCVAMLVGSTFAWFTDTATTGVNKITSGKLDVKLSYAKDKNCTEWAEVKNTTKLFDDSALWEPGHTEVAYLKVENAGNLALKYQLSVNVANEVSGTNVNGESFNLSDYIKMGVVENQSTSFADRNAARTAVEATAQNIKTSTVDGTIAANDTNAQYVALVVYMPETVGNEANYGTKAPSIDLGVKLVATQYTEESDSFGNDYDKDAAYPVIAVADVAQSGDTVLKDNETAPTVTATIPQDSTAASALTLTVDKAATPGNIQVVTGTSAVSSSISLADQDGKAVTAAAGKFFTLDMHLEKNANVIGFYHYDTPLNKVASKDAVKAANDTYYYDAATGILTFSTDDFSPFTVVISDSDFNGGNGKKESPYLIATGEQALKVEDSKGYFKLVNDIVVTDEVYMSGKTYVWDLNGHSIKLEYADGVKPNNGSVLYIGGSKGRLTINDSSEAQTGAVIGSDKTYTNKVTSAVRAGNSGKLTINGGHFYGMSDGTACIFVYGTYASVVINGGVFETASPSNGTYSVLNHQDSLTTGCTITVNGGSFKNYNPGVTVVDPVNAKTGKIVLGKDCTTTSKTDGNDTWYTVSK